MSPIMESRVILPITLNVIKNTRKQAMNKTRDKVPFSGVYPRLNIKSGIGAKNATPKILNKTIFFLSKNFTNLGVK